MTVSTQTNDCTDHLGNRLVGISSGDVVDAVQSEIRRILKQAGGNRAKAVKIAFGLLREQNFISDSDLERSDALMRVLFDLEGEKCSQHEAVVRLDQLYQEAVVDPGATQIGVSMVGVAYSRRQDLGMAAGGLFGMVVGGLVAAAIPGGGVTLGVLVGGLVGGWAGALCETD